MIMIIHIMIFNHTNVTNDNSSHEHLQKGFPRD